MGEPASSRAAAAAATASPSDESDERIARKLHVMEQLVHVFGFPQVRAEEAIDAVGYDDVTACCEYLLDHGEVDKGGPIAPITTCPHVTEHVKLTVNQLPLCPQACVCTYFRDAASAMSDESADSETPKSAGAKEVKTADGKCPAGENWLCLHCGRIRCSRYVNAHGVAHWNETMVADKSSGFGHCIALSLEDFSVWCHVCVAYIQHPGLSPILRQIEALKFPQEMEPSTNYDDVSPSTPPRKAKKARSMRPFDHADGEETAESLLECKALAVSVPILGAYLLISYHSSPFFRNRQAGYFRR
jgi:Zn-finger in ubiquitin-hydrolases and other protein